MTKKFFNLKSLAYFYLGLSITVFTKLDFVDWRFYAIVVPFALLDCLSKNDCDEK